jgi:hypothetical protein
MTGRRRIAYGVPLCVDLDLDLPTTGHPARVVVRRMVDAVAEDTITWLDRDSDPWMSAGVVGSRFYLRFGTDAEFLVSARGETVSWHSAGGPDDLLVHLLLDHVLPRALTRLGRIALHGSCVALRAGSGVALLGRSGSGKSTLAAALIPRGGKVVADDCLAISWRARQPEVASAYPGLRLTDGSIELCGAAGLTDGGPVSRLSAKKRMRPFETDVVLSHPDEPADASGSGTGTMPLGPSAAGIALLRHSFHLNGPDDRASLLTSVVPLAAAVPVVRLHYEHTARGLQVALDAIERLARPARPMAG